VEPADSRRAETIHDHHGEIVNHVQPNPSWLWRLLLITAAVLAVGAVLSSPGAQEIGDSLITIARRISAQFQIVNASTPLARVLLPTALCCAFVYCLMLLFPDGGRWPRAMVILLLVALYTVYIAFRMFATLNFDGWVNLTFSLLFLFAEILIYLKAISGNLQMIWLTNRSAGADRSAALIRSRRYVPTVDIFLPSYSEPADMLRRTIFGCQNLCYPRKTIYLLDDQRRPQMRALARELGCEYRDRPDNRLAKAGNLNAALPTTSGELIACFDADFIPTQDFLERTVGFFIDPKVALVQTPQNFYNVDAIAQNLGLSGIITEEQQLFMRATQPGRDAFGAPICHGTSFIIRRSAIEAVGRFPGETLTEDWATSIKLQAAGYRCYYLNELLSAGMAADSISEFVTQRLRWCRGTLQSLFSSTNPITVPGLRLRQRLVHLCGPLNYLPYLSRSLCLLLPLLYFFFGILPLDTSAEMLLVFFLPYWACQLLALAWISHGHRSAFWSEVYDTMLAWPMTVTIISTFVKPFGRPFKVSEKNLKRKGLKPNLVVGAPLVVLLALYIPAIFWSVQHAQWNSGEGILALALAWSAYSVLLLWLSLQASLDVPQPRVHLGFKYRVPVIIRHHGGIINGITEEISDGEVVVSLDKKAIATAPDSLTITIPAFGLVQVPARVLAVDSTVTLRFKRLSLAQHRALVGLLYCRPGQWDGRGVAESLTFWHFFEAIFRMYPLAEAK
jgi:cellulose synthase (UDP-forming)